MSIPKPSPQAPHEPVDDGLEKVDCWSYNKDIVSSGNRKAVSDEIDRAQHSAGESR